MNQRHTITSPFFGSPAYQYQLLVYPFGVPSSLPNHIAVFLKPKLNANESLRIVSFGVSLLGMKSEESDEFFEGFSTDVKAWGFNDFCQKPLMFSKGSITFQVNIYDNTPAETNYLISDIDVMRKKMEIMEDELNRKREEEIDANRNQLRIGDVKERLIRLRTSMDQELEPLNCIGLDRIPVIRADTAPIISLDTLACTDRMVYSKIPSVFDEGIKFGEDPTVKVSEALQHAHTEVLNGEAAISKVIKTLLNRSMDEVPMLEKATMMADMALVQCGLEVANASLYEIEAHIGDNDANLFKMTKKKIEDIRYEFTMMRCKLDLVQPNLERRISNLQNDTPSAVKMLNVKIDHLESLIKSNISNKEEEIGLWTPKEDKLDFHQIQVKAC